MKDVRLLKEALPYLRRHRRQTMVIKVGGEIAADAGARRSLAQDLSLLTHVNIRIVLDQAGARLDVQKATLCRAMGVEA